MLPATRARLDWPALRDCQLFSIASLCGMYCGSLDGLLNRRAKTRLQRRTFLSGQQLPHGTQDGRHQWAAYQSGMCRPENIY
jgi:hypothetical protein